MARALERSKDALFARLRQVLAAGEEWDEVGAQTFLMDRFAAEDLECDHPPIVAVNAHAGDPHYAPRPGVGLPLRGGDLLLVDL